MHIQELDLASSNIYYSIGKYLYTIKKTRVLVKVVPKREITSAPASAVNAIDNADVK